MKATKKSRGIKNETGITKIATGMCNSVSEVVREAIRLLEERDSL